MSQAVHKGNKIDINDNNDLDIKINGNSIPVEKNDDPPRFSSSLSFDDAASPLDLARAIIDVQSALDVPDILLRDPKHSEIDPSVDVRRNVATLSDANRNKFRDAVFLLKERGEYDKYIKFHGFTDTLGHSGPAFFAWHRVFLRKFELELKQLGERYADIALPYWDYTSPNVDDQNNSRIWRDDFFGANRLVNLTWTGEDGQERKWVLPGYTALRNTVTERDGIYRKDFSLTSRFCDPTRFNDALRLRDYREFEPAFEGAPHGAAHVMLGVNPGDQGPPGRFATAVNDPFFMLLHCNVDRMWAKWQQLMKDQWLADHPGLDYPATQLATDYYWDKSDELHTAPDAIYARRAMPDRHNIDDVLWPWDGSKSHKDRDDSRFILAQDREEYTPRKVLDHREMGYDYDNLDPTGFQE